jgi:hypothetical protein
VKIEQDYIQAYAWVGIVAASGYKPAEKLRDEIASYLKPEELEQAKTSAKKLWKKLGRKINIRTVVSR